MRPFWRTDQTPRVYFDFETASELDITEVNASVYFRHSSTSILCGVFKKGTEYLIVTDFEAQKQEVINFCRGCLFVAHNSGFEYYGWMHILANRHGYPIPPLNRWRCCMAKLLAHGLPRSLEKGAEALDLILKKDMGGHSHMLKMCKINGPRDAENMRILISYCKQDVNVTEQIDLFLPDLSPEEQEVWEFDQEINDLGVQIDIDLVDKIITILEREKELLLNEFTRIIPSNSELTSPTQREKFLEYLRSYGVDAPDATAPTMVSLLNSNKLPANIRRVIEIRQVVMKTSNAKWYKIKATTEDDGRLRCNLIYHAASTGRWGGQGAQLQNLPRPKVNAKWAIETLDDALNVWPLIYGSCAEVASSLVRSAIIG